MTTKLPSQAIHPSLKDGERLPPFDRGLLAVLASWFLGWPIAILACVPSIKDADTVYVFLFGAGCFLWFLSWFGICGAVFAMVDEIRRRSPALYRGIAAVITGWFLSYPVLLIMGSPPLDKSALIFLVVIAGNLVWLASGYWIYDALFSMAAARWPAAKAIREIASPLLAAWLVHHNHSSE